MLKAALFKSDILRSAVGLADLLRMISLSFFKFFLISAYENISLQEERKRKHNTTLWKIWSLNNWFTVILNFQNRPWNSCVMTLPGILWRSQSQTETWPKPTTAILQPLQIRGVVKEHVGWSLTVADITASWCEQRCTVFSGFKQPQDLSFKLPPSSPSVCTRRCAEAAVYPARRTCASLISCPRAVSHARATWGMRHFQNAEFYKKEVSRVKRNGWVCVRGLFFGHAAVR